MEDSVRAAEVARACGIDIGLHLNFTENFTDSTTPSHLREAHTKIARFLRANKYALIFYHPLLRKQFELLFRAQLEEFRKLYGKEPSHFDGHQHMHLASNMLVDGIIPRGAKLRRSFSFAAGQKGILQRAYRKAVNSYLTPRYRTTDYFFALAHHLMPHQMTKLGELAKTHSVEVMAHPELTPDYDALMSDEYASLISANSLTSYAML